MTQLHRHACFFIVFPLWFVIECWRQFPALCSRTWLFIRSVCNSWRLLTPNSQAIRPPARPPAPWQPQTCSVRFICATLWIPRVRDSTWCSSLSDCFHSGRSSLGPSVHEQHTAAHGVERLGHDRVTDLKITLRPTRGSGRRLATLPNVGSCRPARTLSRRRAPVRILGLEGERAPWLNVAHTQPLGEAPSGEFPQV